MLSEIGQRKSRPTPLPFSRIKFGTKMQTAQLHNESAGIDQLLTPEAKPRILFVDDEAALCELLSLYLRGNGFDVTTALTASEARAVVQNTTFDLAILDLNLGADDGLELLNFLKEKCPQLPIVIFTGVDADEALVKKALAGRASGFVRKAQSLQSLAIEVRRHMAACLSR
jgi:DNA-binding response OmpR family regulator